MRNYPNIGIQIPDILIPSPGIDLHRWSVIACDQFTSQMEYWDQVKNIVDGYPSTLDLILPEIYLGKPEESQIVAKTHEKMREFQEKGILISKEGMVLVERETTSGKRFGLVMALDLEKYDFAAGSTSLIRATEATILERLPPRIRIREDAILEIPHIMVLIDDRERSVIEPLKEIRHQLPKLYDFGLMLGSGHISGYQVDSFEAESKIVESLQFLNETKHFNQKYQLKKSQPNMLFAVGDGNHSLATAKVVWQKKKSKLGSNHHLRHALVEVVNIHDDGLIFEPIHRVLFGLRTNVHEALQKFFHAKTEIQTIASFEELTQYVENVQSPEQCIGLVENNRYTLLKIKEPPANIAVASLQLFLDDLMRKNEFEGIDYIHGAESLQEICHKDGNFGFYLPAMDKNELFRTIILEGTLPRKTFSMGEAKDKRFYLECRNIQD
jgi:hypothetical protein